jgi:drug/metabolite transporter (DMT)-like permease
VSGADRVALTDVPAANPAAARRAARSAAARERLGLLFGLLGVLAFSLTLPMTRLAVAELDAWLVGFGRMALAGILSGLWLWLARVPRPRAEHGPWLAASVAGVVIGFPLFSSLAMRTLPAHHGAVINGLLPFATALLAALLLGERHRARFWICAAIGSAIVIGYALRHGFVVGGGHLWMLAAALVCAAGYVAGGRLTRDLGAVNTILWSLVLALPLTLPVAAWLAASMPLAASGLAWAAFAYITLISQIIGFFAWYSGLALGGVARVGQVQLLQAFFTIGFASWVFGEEVDPMTWIAAAAVVAALVIGRSEKGTR